MAALEHHHAAKAFAFLVNTLEQLQNEGDAGRQPASQAHNRQSQQVKKATTLARQWAGISLSRLLQYCSKAYFKAQLQGRMATGPDNRKIIRGPGREVFRRPLTIRYRPPGPRSRARKSGPMSYGLHPSPFGRCLLVVEQDAVVALRFCDCGVGQQVEKEPARKWADIHVVRDQQATKAVFDRLFNGSRPSREPLSLVLHGTPFQHLVWKTLLEIPFGAVVSYQHIAEAIGRPRAVRAVATAIGHNPVAWIIPCHRVIGKNGSMTGYRWGKQRKRLMLAWEAANLDGIGDCNQRYPFTRATDFR